MNRRSFLKRSLTALGLAVAIPLMPSVGRVVVPGVETVIIPDVSANLSHIRVSINGEQYYLAISPEWDRYASLSVSDRGVYAEFSPSLVGVDVSRRVEMKRGTP